MKNLALFFLLILFSITSYATSINLLEAQKQKKVSVVAIGNGGYNGECIKLALKNSTSTKQEIEISPGLIFTSLDSTSQDLMVVKDYMVELMPGASKSLNLYTMCIKLHSLSPLEGSLFVLNKEATGNLSYLADLIALKNYQNSTAQSAVWALTDRSEIGDIYDTDTTMAGELVTFISKATGIPRPKIIKPKEHYIYSIRMNITHHFSKPTKVTLACFDADGNLIKQYYKDRIIPVGMYIATFGINKVADKGTKFIYRLSDDKGVVIKERIITESVNDSKVEKWKLDIAFEYVLEKPVNGATMSLYDDKGNLMENLYTNRNLPAGGRRQAYTFHNAYGPTAAFYLRLKDATGKIIVEEKLDGSKSVKVP